MNPLLAPPISNPVPNVFDIKREPLIKFCEPPMYWFPPANTNGEDSVSVLDISPIELRYCIFNNLGSCKFSDGIGIFTLNEELNGTATSFNNSNSPGNPSDFWSTFTLSTTPAIGSTSVNAKLTNERWFSVVTLEPLLTYCIVYSDSSIEL